MLMAYNNMAEDHVHIQVVSLLKARFMLRSIRSIVTSF